MSNQPDKGKENGGLWDWLRKLVASVVANIVAHQIKYALFGGALAGVTGTTVIENNIVHETPTDTIPVSGSSAEALDFQTQLDSLTALVDDLMAPPVDSVPAQEPPPPPPSRGRLVLVSLECIEQEDYSGEDDAYLRVDGETVWRGGMEDGDAEDLLPILRPIPFARSVRIDLREGDWLDPNDHLGTTYARVSYIGQGERTHRFRGDGANYLLTYRVIP